MDHVVKVTTELAFLEGMLLEASPIIFQWHIFLPTKYSSLSQNFSQTKTTLQMRRLAINLVILHSQKQIQK